MLDYKTRKKISGLANTRGLVNIGRHFQRRIGTVSERAFVGPNQIRLNPLSYTCNQRCPMCNLQQMSREDLSALRRKERFHALTVKDYQTLFQNQLPGLVSVNVTGGGEPLMHPEIIDILKEIKRNKIKGSLITNGLLLKKSLFQELVEMTWDGIRVSVHAPEAGAYKVITGLDNFDKLVCNLNEIGMLRKSSAKARNCQFILFSVIQRENVATIEKIFELADRIDADFVEFDRIIGFDQSKCLTYDELEAAKKKIQWCAGISRIPFNTKSILKQLDREQIAIKRNNPLKPAKRCSVGFDQLFITSTGDVYPCCFSDEKMGNIKQASLGQIWQNDLFNDFRKRLIQGKFAKYCYTSHCTLTGVLHNW